MLRLTRLASSRQTLGILRVIEDGEEVFSCATLELPWNANNQLESCIHPKMGDGPEEYKTVPHDSPKFGESLWVKQIEGRSGILFHAGNYLSDTQGCILVGREFCDINNDGLIDVSMSRAAMNELLRHVDEETMLRIGWRGEVSPAFLEEASQQNDGMVSTEHIDEVVL